MSKQKSEESLNPNRFTTVMDWWVAILVIVFLFMIVVSIPLVIAKASILASVVASAFLIATFMLITDKAFFTSYVLEPEGLFIQSQLTHHFIPYASMEAIRHGNVLGLFSIGQRKRFALSSNLLVITLDDSFPYRFISISPERRQEFLSSLLEYHPSIQHRKVKLKSKRTKR